MWAVVSRDRSIVARPITKKKKNTKGCIKDRKLGSMLIILHMQLIDVQKSCMGKEGNRVMVGANVANTIT